MYAYSKKYNYIINWSPKSGCTLFRKIFLELHKEELKNKPSNLWHDINIDFPKTSNIIKSSIPNIYLCRNPYKRVVSMFCNKYCGKTYSSIIRNIIMLDKITFYNFVLKLKELKDTNILNTNKSDIHINQQFLNFEKTDNTYIIKLENFNKEIIKVYNEL